LSTPFSQAITLSRRKETFKSMIGVWCQQHIKPGFSKPGT